MRSRQAAVAPSFLWALIAGAGWPWAASGPMGRAHAAETPAAVPAPPAATLQYNRDIRPILAENCFACHGPDSASRKADLRLDRREAAIEMAAIAPGDPAASQLIERITSDDPEVVMPPPKTKKTLTAEQKERLRRWIAEGAPYEPHWSLIAPVRPPLPIVHNMAWVKNPIDAFVLAKLEAAGLAPAAEADRRTLARRLSLDLTGLPPEPADVEAFVTDPSPTAYEDYVQRLMDSPAWGEHRGRYWLDAARYADTHGIHFDNYREMWSYRDWVIGAFNRNLPFDRFTIDQLAGDLLPGATLDQRVASGFNRCNMTTNEGGTIPEEYLVHYTRDRVEATAQVWMGMGAACMVCHDHKFDQFTQREFYQMAAFFNNTTQPAMDGNIHDTPPVIFVPQPADRPRWDALEGELVAARQDVESGKASARGAFDQWLASGSAGSLAAQTPSEALRLHVPLAEDAGSKVNLIVDGQPREIAFAKDPPRQAGHVAAQAFTVSADSVVELADAGDFERDQPFSYAAWVKLPTNGQFGSVLGRMNEPDAYRGWDLWLENGRLGTHIIHAWDTDALKVVSTAPVQVGQWTHVLVTYDGSSKAAGVKIYLNGRPQELTVVVDRLQNTIRTNVPLKVGQRYSSARLDGLAVQDVRVYSRALSPEEGRLLAMSTRVAHLAAVPAERRSDAERNELFEWWLAAMHKPYQDLLGRATALEQEQAAIRSRGTIAHVMQEKNEPPVAFVLYRGEYDKRRDQLVPGVPAVLPPMPDELPKNRLGFAQWMLRPEHPLTARVTVNRFWQDVFGTGIVKTANDFGVAGELPSHQELLDWLAVDFRESGWDVKRLFKLFVTSATYRQSAAVTPEKLEKDPANRLLSRGPRYRMDAEMVRDYALAASGLLVRKLGGPSVRPYQPDGVWEAVAMIGSNTRDYRRDTGENLYRRSLYTFWKRAAPPATMEIFNAPNREVCTVRRERTNTPLQALATLNDPQFVEAARHLAQRALKEGGEAPAHRIEFVAQRLLARSLRPEEMALVQLSLDDLAAYYQAHPADATTLLAVGESKADPTIDPGTLAAWTMLVNELMNLDEVLNK